MREIKFRGLNRNSNEWKYGYLVVDEKYTQIWQKGDVPVIVDPETIGQFINLRDKNNKEIYEGDRIKSKYEFGWPFTDDSEVFFSHQGAEVKIGDSFVLLTNLKDVEIIGNIYENPEL